MKLRIALLFALASSAFAGTISTYTVSASASGGIPCFKSGFGPGSASCSSQGFFFGLPVGGSAFASLTNDSLGLAAGSTRTASGSASASIVHDDFYSVSQSNTVFALFHVVCQVFGDRGGPLLLQYSIGAGPLTSCSFDQNGARGFEVVAAFTVTNGTIEVMTSAQGSTNAGDDNTSVNETLSLVGFQDASGKPIAATLIPEPGTCGMLTLASVVGILQRRRKQQQRE